MPSIIIDVLIPFNIDFLSTSNIFLSLINSLSFIFIDLSFLKYIPINILLTKQNIYNINPILKLLNRVKPILAITNDIDGKYVKDAKITYSQDGKIFNLTMTPQYLPLLQKIIY